MSAWTRTRKHPETWQATDGPYTLTVLHAGYLVWYWRVDDGHGVTGASAETRLRAQTAAEREAARRRAG